MDQLETLLADCVQGRGSAVAISGPVGSGKTQALYAVGDMAVERGGRFLSATASVGEQQLPLGVIDQLLHRAGLPDVTVAKIAALIEVAPCAIGVGASAVARLVQDLSKALLELAGTAPLVIGIDDVHHADALSQQCLAWLIRRLRRSRLMVVLTETPQLMPTFPAIHAELTHVSHCRTLRLGPLSQTALADLLARDLGHGSEALADPYRDVSGGNPLLVSAMIEDANRLEVYDRVVADDAFGKAVMSCLYRYEPATLSTARAVAVIDGVPRPELLSQVLRLTPDIVSGAIQLLAEAGLLGPDGTFRHPRARAAVAAGMTAEECADLHGRTAHLLHSAGEPATTVARHLILADSVDPGWGVDALIEGAKQALSAGENDEAVALLLHARNATADDRRREEVTSLLSRVTWRTNPTSALAHAAEVVAAVREDRLDEQHAIVPLSCLLWLGRVDQALDVVDRLRSRDDLSAETARSIGNALLLLAYMFPEHAEQARRYRVELAGHATPETQTRLSAAVTRLAEVVESGGAGGDAPVEAAEQVLNRLHLDDETIVPALVALSVLVRADRCVTAASWCELLLDAASARRAPAWQAALSALGAQIAFRRGDLAGAERYVSTALEIMPLRGFGLAAASVLATRVLIATAAGRFDEAAECLAEPIHSATFRTPFGLAYLYARANYYLATGRPGAAAMDAQACGDAMDALGLELPTLLPWRLSLARAHLARGRPEQARALAREQLRRAGEGQPRVRGLSLVLLASTSEPPKRLPMLREAIDLLQASGDRMEVARAYADLSDALLAVGAGSRARLATHTARHIAAQCEGYALVRRLRPDAPAIDGPSAAVAPVSGTAGSGDCEGIGALSEAERRVATLAAQGHTNREIAGKLFLTVSTVEQHLTRVYRKLRVTRRSDLPSDLVQNVQAAG